MCFSLQCLWSRFNPVIFCLESYCSDATWFFPSIFPGTCFCILYLPKTLLFVMIIPLFMLCIHSKRQCDLDRNQIMAKSNEKNVDMQEYEVDSYMLWAMRGSFRVSREIVINNIFTFASYLSEYLMGWMKFLIWIIACHTVRKMISYLPETYFWYYTIFNSTTPQVSEPEVYITFDQAIYCFLYN